MHLLLLLLGIYKLLYCHDVTMWECSNGSGNVCKIPTSPLVARRFSQQGFGKCGGRWWKKSETDIYIYNLGGRGYWWVCRFVGKTVRWDGWVTTPRIRTGEVWSEAPDVTHRFLAPWPMEIALGQGASWFACILIISCRLVMPGAIRKHAESFSNVR